MPELRIHTLPQELCLPLVAAWRTIEKSVNPVFSLILKCSSCGKLTDQNRTQGPDFIHSKKKKHGMPIVIGIQCQTEDCDMVIKFDAPISPGNPDFPMHLQKRPQTGLTDPEGKQGKKFSSKGMAELLDLLDLSEDE